MIARYTRKEMGGIWSEEAKYRAWLRVEVAVCEAYARRGRIPAAAMERIRATRVDLPRIAAVLERVKHEMIAFLTSLEEQLVEDSRFVHIGLTSNDVWDTALALQLRDATDLLLAGQARLRDVLADLARRHKDTLVAGRTHGVHAEPTSFGLKAAVWYAEAGRNLDRLARARAAVAVGKLSGAVGNFAHVEPEIEEEVCRALGLAPAPVSTQVVQRDRHAEFVAMLAVAAASLEKIALEVRGLQRTEVLEAQEPFAEGQKGSSAMPHKRNPELAERVCGLARLVRSHAGAALENVALWHERDISHSSVERVILPDATIVLDYLLDLTRYILEGLEVDPARMAENLERSYGLVYSQRVLLRLAESGLARQRAYEIVQRNAMQAWRERRPFQELLMADPDVTGRLSAAEVDGCFDPTWYLRNVDAVFRRVGLLSSPAAAAPAAASSGTFPREGAGEARARTARTQRERRER
jgi:adenylosuccinate lyase